MVETPFGKGEVVSSILTGSTMNPKEIKSVPLKHFLVPPRLRREQIAFPPPGLGEN